MIVAVIGSIPMARPKTPEAIIAEQKKRIALLESAIRTNDDAITTLRSQLDQEKARTAEAHLQRRREEEKTQKAYQDNHRLDAELSTLKRALHIVTKP
jgi:septal ring factor EnvC (AmiA/AmiB activator)